MLDSFVVRNEMSEGLSIGHAYTSTSSGHGSYQAASIQPVLHASCSLGRLVLVTAIVRQESSRARSDAKASALSPESSAPASQRASMLGRLAGLILRVMGSKDRARIHRAALRSHVLDFAEVVSRSASRRGRALWHRSQQDRC